MILTRPSRITAGLALGLLAIAAPAFASVASPDDRVLVSHDGVTFTASPHLGLFLDAGVVVPGDTSTQHVWVKNASDEPGRLRIDLYQTATTDLDLANAMSIAVEGGWEASIAEVIEAGDCVVMSTDTMLAPGEATRVMATLAVDPTLGDAPHHHGRAGQRGEVSFQLRAVLTDATVEPSVTVGEPCGSLPNPTSQPTAEPTAEPTPPTPTTPDIPATGTRAHPAAIFAALVAAVAGLALVRRRRNRPAERA